MESKKKPAPVQDRRLVFSHKNLQRWAIWSTTPNMDERVLVRYGVNGEISEKVIIGSVKVNGQARTLSVEEGKMMNLIEGLHDRYRPLDGKLRVEISKFYDFVVDIGAFNDPSRIKKRHSVKYRNYVYDRLYVLMGVPIIWTDWKEKSGFGSAQRFNLIDAFKMYGKTKGAERGIIEITINPVVAAGLRERHTSPILLEVANAMDTPASWTLYRYLDKVLSKRQHFEIRLDDYIKRLVMTERYDSCFRKIRAAIDEINKAGNEWKRDLTCGRLTLIKLERRNDTWWIIAERGRRITVKEKSNNASSEVALVNTQFDDYIVRYKNLPDDVRAPLEKKIKAILAAHPCGKPGAMGYETLVECITKEVMEEFMMSRINDATAQFCGGETVVDSTGAIRMSDSAKDPEYTKSPSMDEKIHRALLMILAFPVNRRDDGNNTSAG